ncbi:MAG TPA: hypothetical protein VFI45_22155, partial [Candidatus Acidoferrum sp.]|nr:hypothetical protein [Candidatus Acidoferrum sp.]
TPLRHREIGNDKLPIVREQKDAPVQARGIPGKNNPGDDFRPAVSLREVRLPILPLVLQHQAQRFASDKRACGLKPRCLGFLNSFPASAVRWGSCLLWQGRLQE